MVINSAVVIVLAASFFHPKGKRDWSALGAFSAFMVALLTEMYGVPLTHYFLIGWLGHRFPELTVSHAGGHI